MFNFGASTQRQIVGVNVSPNLGVEVIVIDGKENVVEKYAQRYIEYDAAKREINDYEEFKNVVRQLFAELNIALKADVFVTLPNVVFGFINLPSEIEDDEIQSILTSKSEESYIFKQTDPVVAYANASVTTAASEDRYLVYSALQRNAVEAIQDVFSEIGANLIGIESSFSAMFRGIDFSGIVEEAIASRQNWNVLLVGGNSYALFALSGNNIFDYVEIPIAIKSLAYEEAYQAIATSIAQNLPNYPASKLLIISQTDDISADVLRTQIRFEEEVDTLECNKYAKRSYAKIASTISEDEAKHISLSAIGAAYGTSSVAFSMNVLGSQGAPLVKTINFGGQTMTFTPETASGALTVLGLILAALFFAAFVGLNFWDATLKAGISDKETRKAAAEAEIAILEPKVRKTDITTLINNVIEGNKKFINYYDAVSIDIPKNMWLTSFYSRMSDGDNVAIEGLALGINDIYEFYKGIKGSMPTSGIRLNRLRALTDTYNQTFDPEAKDEIKLYDFEISSGTKVAPSLTDPNADPNAAKTADPLSDGLGLEPLGGDLTN